MRLYNLSRNLLQCFNTVAVKKSFFLHLNGISCISVYTSWPFPGTTEKILDLSSFLALTRCLYFLARSSQDPPSLQHTGQCSSQSYLTHQVPQLICSFVWPSVGLVPTCFSLILGTELDTALRPVSPVQSRGEGSSLSICWQ